MATDESKRMGRPASEVDGETATERRATADEGRSGRGGSGGRPRNPNASPVDETPPAPAEVKKERRPPAIGHEDGLEDGPVGGPAARRALRSQGRRTMRRLLDAAMKAIDERGYHSTRVQDVVDIANTSHGTFYLYFSSKEDLVRALTIEAANEATDLSRAMSDAGESLDFESWDRLRTWVAGYSVLWARYAPLFRSWTDLAAIDPGVEQQIRRMVLAHTEAVANRVTAAARPDGLDPHVAGTAVVAMLDRFHFLREFVGQPIDDTAIDTLTTIIHRTLFADGK
jgi:AcrR family transcriptional regulator